VCSPPCRCRHYSDSVSKTVAAGRGIIAPSQRRGVRSTAPFVPQFEFTLCPINTASRVRKPNSRRLGGAAGIRPCPSSSVCGVAQPSGACNCLRAHECPGDASICVPPLPNRAADRIEQALSLSRAHQFPPQRSCSRSHTGGALPSGFCHRELSVVGTPNIVDGSRNPFSPTFFPPGLTIAERRINCHVLS